ncbi:pirin family protein [Ochrovirga pacifica]|uniref:pirin family protein n=1 Tax=Ochrovirga pacifica TaxID=1042376 RepID=UPI000255A563|nr:pirin family protein [Ochrovirga pacifica]
MKKTIHRAGTRGHANHGWLDSHHTFSFAGYHEPTRMNFGVLRVLNDDKVAGGKGFGTHPHDNMEIISIPLSGDLEHKDSMGTHGVIKEGDIQVMSAGTGVYHSEFNKNADIPVEFLQIWLFPNKKDVTPRYDQQSIKELEKQNEFYQILSPNAEDEGVWIHQDAYFSMGKFDGTTTATYQLQNKENGLYVFVLYGDLRVDDTELISRDGLGIQEADEVHFEFKTSSHILLMEVPMV